MQKPGQGGGRGKKTGTRGGVRKQGRDNYNQPQKGYMMTVFFLDHKDFDVSIMWKDTINTLVDTKALFSRKLVGGLIDLRLPLHVLLDAL